MELSRGGGTGRREGLKSPCQSTDVGVRVPPSALGETASCPNSLITRKLALILWFNNTLPLNVNLEE